jgi:Ran GTPase-activating protein (RanGAP) involved in mRNA processing and transport
MSIKRFYHRGLHVFHKDHLEKIKAKLLAENDYTEVSIHSFPFKVSWIDEALKRQKDLVRIDMNFNMLKNGAAFKISQLLQLKFVNLSNNWIGDEGLKALVQNTSLTTLDLGCNQIKDVRPLAKALLQNTTLTIINLKKNRVGCRGAKHLARALYKNTTLRYLNLDGCYIQDQGTIALAKALHVNTTLRKLVLFYNGIMAKGAMALAKMIGRNESLEDLDFRFILPSLQTQKHLNKNLFTLFDVFGGDAMKPRFARRNVLLRKKFFIFFFQ